MDANAAISIVFGDEEDSRMTKLQEIFRNMSFKILNLFYSVILFGYIMVLCDDNNYILITNIILLTIIIIDTIYAFVKREGKEFKWFSINVCSFSIMFILYVWVSLYFKMNRDLYDHHRSVLVSIYSSAARTYFILLLI